MKKNDGKMINLKMQVMAMYRYFSGKHGIWKLVTRAQEDVASIQ